MRGCFYYRGAPFGERGKRDGANDGFKGVAQRNGRRAVDGGWERMRPRPRGRTGK